MEASEHTLKPDLEATLVRIIIYLAVLNLPFCGVYKQAALGNWGGDQPIFLAVALLFLAASLAFCYLFQRIRFGWNAQGVYKQGMFWRTDIAWDEIVKIYDTGSAQEWTEGDLLFMKYRSKGKRVFVIQSCDKKIVLEIYRSVIDFKLSLSRKFNLAVGDQYNVLWDFLVNS